MNRAHLDIPPCTLRALHSGLVDWLGGIDVDLRDSYLHRMNGIDFAHFALAVGDGRFTVSTRIDGDSAVVGLAVPTRGRFDSMLFELPSSHSGINASWLISAGLVDLDDKLSTILGGDQ